MSASVGRAASMPRWPALSLVRLRSAALADATVVAGLLVLAAVVRAPYLWDVPRFTDEVNEAYRALQIAQGRALPLTNVDPYVGPLWNYLLAGAFLLFGPSLASPRVVVALLGVLAVVPTYLLGRSIGEGMLAGGGFGGSQVGAGGGTVARGEEREYGLTGDNRAAHGQAGRWVGGIAALFLATSPVHVAVNSHIAWSNCVTPLLTTLALWLTHRAMAADRPGALGWAGLAWGLALQSHPTAVLFVPGVALAVAHARPRWLRTRWPWVAAGLGLAACSLLVVANVGSGLGGIQVGWLVQAQYSGGDALDLDVYRRRLHATISLLSDSLGGALTETDSLRGLLGFPLGLLLTVPVLFGLDLTARRRTWLLLLAIATYVLLLPVVNGRFESTVPKARYVAPLLPLCYVAIGMLVVEMYGRVGRFGLGRPVAGAPTGPTRLGRGVRLALVLGVAALLVLPLGNLRAYYRESVASGRTNDALYRTIAAIDAARRPDDVVHVDRSLDRTYTLGGGQWVEHLRLAAGVHGWPRQPVSIPRTLDDPPPAVTGLLVVAVQNVPLATITLRLEPIDAALPADTPVRLFRVLKPRPGA